MNKICVFAGTTEGRALAEFLQDFDVQTTVCVATEYGETLIENKNINIHQGRMNETEIADFITSKAFDIVIDCTHPYAQIVTENILKACQSTKTICKRVKRESGVAFDGVIVNSTEEARAYLEKTTGNILCTLGSKELEKFKYCSVIDRFYARVLPMRASIEACEKVGIPPAQIIAMQGPFSAQMNNAMIDCFDIKIMLTKDSGKAGGFAEKVKTATDKNLELVVIKRPEEKGGYSLEEIKMYFKKNFPSKVQKHIDLIAVGVGNLDLLTPQAKNAMEKADVIIGAKRLTDSLKSFNKPIFNEIYSEKITDYIKNSNCENIAVALSGDIGFYSGAKKLNKALQAYEVNNICGISSLVYLSAKLKTSWEDIKLVSLHGRENNIIASVKSNEKVFTLLGGKNTVHALCQKLIDYNLDVTVAVGENLSYKNEKITKAKPFEILKCEFESLACAIIFNENYGNTNHFGIADDDFIRIEKVPMTKSEVRAISLSKLKLSDSSVVYDIGAGTGSVSIEIALQSPNGQVYAVERNEKAIEAIRQNKLRFKTDNLSIVSGLAPDCLESLPTPTHAFIGGSSGNLEEIVTAILQKNLNTNFVLNTVSLETLAEAILLMKKFNYSEVVQINVAKAKELGKYNLMMANNPINIITFRN